MLGYSEVRTHAKAGRQNGTGARRVSARAGTTRMEKAETK